MTTPVKISEKACKSALVKSGIPGIAYAINPYGGCGHGCVYCYASFMKRFLGESDRWGTFVQVKTDIADRLAAELRRCRPGRIMLSSVTDPYQPAEETYRRTRACLSLLAGTGLPVSILTKSDLVLRDLDLIRKFADIEVGFSVTTVDDPIAAVLEPGASSPSRRFAAARALADAGIRTWIFNAPVIPGIGDSEEAIRAILSNAREAGARDVEYDPLTCYPATVANLRQVFREHWPEKLPSLEAACRDQALWERDLRERAGRLWAEYGFIVHRE